MKNTLLILAGLTVILLVGLPGAQSQPREVKTVFVASVLLVESNETGDGLLPEGRQTVIQPDNPAIRGMVTRIQHLVKAEAE